MSAESKELRAATKAELAEVPSAKPALKKIFWGLVAMVVVAVGNFISSAAPELATLALSMLPSFVAGFVGPKLQILIASAAAAIIAWGRAQASDAVIEAKASEPTDAVKELYVKKQIFG